MLARRASSIGTVMRRRIARIVSHRAASASSRHSAGSVGEELQMHAVLFAEPRAPRLLRGEAQHRREPGGQAAMQMVQHGARGAAAQDCRAGRSRSRPCARRSRTPTDRWRRNCAARDTRRSSRSSAPPRGCAHPVRSAGAAPSSPAPASRAYGTRSASVKPARLPSSQRSVLRSRRYSSACCFRISGPMRRSSDGIRHHHPQPQDVDAVLVRDLLRRGDVAEGLRHLASLLVHHEAIGQHRLERRHAARADRFQQRRLEPAAMLVGAFQIQIGRPGQAARLQHEGVRRAGLRTRHRRCP